MVKMLGRQGYGVTTLDDLTSGHRDAVLCGDFVQGDMGDRAVLDAVSSRGGSLYLFVHGLLKLQKVGNQTQFSANMEHPVFPELSALVRKTTGLRDVLALALAPLASQIEVAFVFGSMAKASEGPQSDVDLLLIGDVTFGQVANAVYDAQMLLAREINPKVMNRVEWSDKKNAQNVFVHELMDKPKIFIVGSEHEL